MSVHQKRLPYGWLPASVDTDGPQRLVNYLTYREATAGLQAIQAAADSLAKEVKQGWRKAAKGRLAR